MSKPKKKGQKKSGKEIERQASILNLLTAIINLITMITALIIANKN